VTISSSSNSNSKGGSESNVNNKRGHSGKDRDDTEHKDVKSLPDKDSEEARLVGFAVCLMHACMC
jgi:hypothetical protein